MGKRYIAQNAQCPFYHSEEPQKIYCEGIQEGSSLHLAFGSKADALAYRGRYCKKTWEACRISVMLEEKYRQ